jgi:uncharacterized membrane protein
MHDSDTQTETPRMGPVALFIRGIAMGAADVVPGVSGGTIAFITGIYHQFIDSLRSLSLQPLLYLVSGRFGLALSALKSFHWHTLIPLGLGVGLSIVTLSKLVTTCMDDYPAPTYALFFGLILFSAIAPFIQIQKKSPAVIISFALSAILAWSFVGLHPDASDKRTLRADTGAKTMMYAGKIRTMADVTALTALRDADHPKLALRLFDPKGIISKDAMPINAVKLDSKAELKTWVDEHTENGALDLPLVVIGEQSPNLLWIFVSGFIAISAMVLPGLSGSFLLLFLGLYHVIFGALHGVIGAVLNVLGRPSGPLQLISGTTGFSDLFIVMAFGFGVLLGLAVFSRVVAWLFERAKDLTLSALTGLMIGALRLPATQIAEGTNDFSQGLVSVLATALLGAIIVLVLMRIDLKRNAPVSSKIPE